MAAYTISFAKGTGYIRHNNRNFIAKGSNIDPSKTSDNVILIQDDIQDVYHELFDSALTEYNAKQVQKNHPERQIKNYLKHIENGKQEKTYHEIIIQIGNKDSMPNEDVAIDVMKSYLEKFKTNNPNLRVFNAVIHLDETTPHMHIDYIPFVTGQKRGLETRVSNDKALKQQGYDSWQNWREQNITLIADIMREHELGHKIVHNIDTHLSVSAYKTLQKAVESKISDFSSKPEELPMPPIKKSLTGKKTVNFEDYLRLKRHNEELLKQNKEYRYMINASDSVLTDTEKKLSDYRSRSYVKENDKLRSENQSLKQNNAYLETKLNRLELHNTALETQYKSLSSDYSRLKRRFDALLKKFDELKDLAVKTVQAIKTLVQGKHSEINDYQVIAYNTDEPQEALVNAIQKTYSDWFRKQGHIESQNQVDNFYGITRQDWDNAVKKEISKDEPLGYGRSIESEDDGLSL